MTEFTLVLVDTTGVQQYIFGSNRLRENAAASYLVYQATEGWLLEEPEVMLNTTKHNLASQQLNQDLRIERHDLDAELFYAGGGNCAILFRTIDLAMQFASQLSGRLLTEAPGLDAVLVTRSFAWREPLAAIMQDALSELTKKKAEREWSQPLQGLGVTAACQSTGLAASDVMVEQVGENLIPVSAEVAAKWNKNRSANQYLQETFSLGNDEFIYTNQFDLLGRSTGEFSYIAVVHADGNGMGKHLETITKKFAQVGSEKNREYIDAVRRFSNEIRAAGKGALRSVIDAVLEWNQSDNNKLKPAIDKEAGKKCLSVRPIVFGGDDVTFVCDGRIGLRAAKVFLDAFGDYTIHDANGERKPTIAAAGVAIVKVHYPFARAYQLSAELCQNAKNADRSVPMLDWHMAQSGLSGSLESIRGREYAVASKSLLMRPLALQTTTPLEWQTWNNFQTILATFQTREEWSRNKVMALREILREGPEAVSAFLLRYDLNLPEIDTVQTTYLRTGWSGNRCVYFDATEMIEQEILL
ncbi:hypothetical protein GC175_18350 [bacterium]|nr:hypothetical protein [bacterium]